MRTLRLGIAILLAGLVLHADTERGARAQEPKKRPPIWSRLQKATTIVIGQVIGFEDKTVEAIANPQDKEKHTYKIARVKVNDLILGAKDLKEVKVGFFKDDELKADQEAVFILSPHYKEPFFIFQDTEQDLFGTDHRYFELRTKILRDAARCLANPNEMLKSQEARERLLTASILISRYRDDTVGTKTEPIDAEQSKLLLRALRDADWGKEDKSYRLMPQPIFVMLGLTDKDGWTGPKEPAAIREAAENWLIDNHSKYRIKRFVPDPASK